MGKRYIRASQFSRSSCLKLKDIEESVFWEPEKVVASSKWS